MPGSNLVEVEAPVSGRATSTSWGPRNGAGASLLASSLALIAGHGTPKKRRWTEGDGGCSPDSPRLQPLESCLCRATPHLQTAFAKIPSMRRVACIALLAATACEEPDGRSDTVSFFVPPTWPELSQEAIDETEFIYGIELVPEDGAPGAVAVFLVEDGTQGWGSGASCTPWIFSPAEEPRLIAHEMGHALGLVHVDDSSNIMHPLNPGEDITDQQIDQIRQHAWVLNTQCSSSFRAHGSARVDASVLARMGSRPREETASPSQGSLARRQQT